VRPLALNNRNSIEVNIPKVKKDLEAGFQTAVTQAAYRVHNELVSKILVGQRAGKRYVVPATRGKDVRGTSAGEGKKPKKPVYYYASRPGEAPASRLGDLRTSYRPVVKGKGILSRGIVGTPLLYGYFLEHGTVHMAKRPHLKRAFDESQKDWLEFFKDILE
jgi:hypothetical protein